MSISKESNAMNAQRNGVEITKCNTAKQSEKKENQIATHHKNILQTQTKSIARVACTGGQPTKATSAAITFSLKVIQDLALRERDAQKRLWAKENEQWIVERSGGERESLRLLRTDQSVGQSDYE